MSTILIQDLQNMLNRITQRHWYCDAKSLFSTYKYKGYERFIESAVSQLPVTVSVYTNPDDSKYVEIRPLL